MINNPPRKIPPGGWREDDYPAVMLERETFQGSRISIEPLGIAIVGRVKDITVAWAKIQPGALERRCGSQNDSDVPGFRIVGHPVRGSRPAQQSRARRHPPSRAFCAPQEHQMIAVKRLYELAMRRRLH